jgi:hypothetical protein
MRHVEITIHNRPVNESPTHHRHANGDVSDITPDRRPAAGPLTTSTIPSRRMELRAESARVMPGPSGLLRERDIFCTRLSAAASNDAIRRTQNVGTE